MKASTLAVVCVFMTLAMALSANGMGYGYSYVPYYGGAQGGSNPLGIGQGGLCKYSLSQHYVFNCTTIHRYPIFSTRYSVMCKVCTGYCGTSEIEHGLCACTVDLFIRKLTTALYIINILYIRKLKIYSLVGNIKMIW